MAQRSSDITKQPRRNQLHHSQIMKDPFVRQVLKMVRTFTAFYQSKKLTFTKLTQSVMRTAETTSPGFCVIDTLGSWVPRVASSWEERGLLHNKTKARLFLNKVSKSPLVEKKPQQGGQGASTPTDILRSLQSLREPVIVDEKRNRNKTNKQPPTPFYKKKQPNWAQQIQVFKRPPWKNPSPATCSLEGC